MRPNVEFSKKAKIRFFFASAASNFSIRVSNKRTRYQRKRVWFCYDTNFLKKYVHRPASSR